MANFNINTAGFVIVGHVHRSPGPARLLIWKFGHVEEKWSAKLVDKTSATQFEADLAAQWVETEGA